MRKLAVVGAEGLLGQAVCTAAGALPKAPEIILLDLPALDITLRESVEACVGLREADVIINCAAYTDVERAEEEEEKALRVNAEGVRNLAEIARAQNSFFVHVSTDFVFDGRSETAYVPDDPTAPLSAYGRTKLAGEVALLEVAPRFALVRTAWLFGAGGHNFVERMLNLAAERDRLEVVCDQVGAPTYTPDLAEVLLALATRQAEGVFHCTNAGRASWHQLTCEIIRQRGLRVQVDPLTTPEATERFNLQATRPAFSTLDCSGVEEVLGQVMRPWEEALADYLQKRSTK